MSLSIFLKNDQISVLSSIQNLYNLNLYNDEIENSQIKVNNLKIFY